MYALSYRFVTKDLPGTQHSGTTEGFTQEKNHTSKSPFTLLILPTDFLTTCIED